MTFAGPELLTSDHVLAGFDCGTPALNAWLLSRALANQSSGTNRSWVITDSKSRRVVAFYASSTASVIRSSVPRLFGRDHPEEIPAILLGRMAVDSSYQGCGFGAGLLKHFMLKAIQVSTSVGVRLVLVHAKDECAKEFYERYGFVESRIDPLSMMLLLGDL
ncbi:MAG: GNAT family N-acetyltransferase [Acidimicrobiales bacterium]